MSVPESVAAQTHRSPENLVENVVRLVSLPEVCVRVNELIEDPSVSVTEIGRVIAQDAALTARLLKVVNSPFYGYAGRIDTIERAVTVIGMHDLRVLILATAAVHAFSRIPQDLVNMASFWRHSAYAAVMARLLAAHCDVLHPERLFVAGLLHDVGQLVHCLEIPDVVREVLVTAGEDEVVQAQLERDLLGFSHADTGAALMRAWRLPEWLARVCEHHHAPEEAGRYALDAGIVHAADLLVWQVDRGVAPVDALDSVAPAARELCRLHPDMVDDLAMEAALGLADALEIVLPSVSAR